jgi:hypothetical protein
METICFDSIDTEGWICMDGSMGTRRIPARTVLTKEDDLCPAKLVQALCRFPLLKAVVVKLLLIRPLNLRSVEMPWSNRIELAYMSPAMREWRRIGFTPFPWDRHAVAVGESVPSLDEGVVEALKRWSEGELPAAEILAGLGHIPHRAQIFLHAALRRTGKHLDSYDLRSTYEMPSCHKSLFTECTTLLGGFSDMWQFLRHLSVTIDGGELVVKEISVLLLLSLDRLESLEIRLISRSSSDLPELFAALGKFPRLDKVTLIGTWINQHILEDSIIPAIFSTGIRDLCFRDCAFLGCDTKYGREAFERLIRKDISFRDFPSDGDTIKDPETGFVKWDNEEYDEDRIRFMDIDDGSDTWTDGDYAPPSPSSESQHPDFSPSDPSNKSAVEYSLTREDEADDEDDPFDGFAPFNIHNELPIARLTAGEVSRCVTLEEVDFELMLSGESWGYPGQVLRLSVDNVAQPDVDY